MTTYTPRHTAHIRSDRDNRLRWGDVTDSLGTYRGLVSVSDLPVDPPARHRGTLATTTTTNTTPEA